MSVYHFTEYDQPDLAHFDRIFGKAMSLFATISLHDKERTFRLACLWCGANCYHGFARMVYTLNRFKGVVQSYPPVPPPPNPESQRILR